MGTEFKTNAGAQQQESTKAPQPAKTPYSPPEIHSTLVQKKFEDLKTQVLVSGKVTPEY